MDRLKQDECWHFSCTFYAGIHKRYDGDFVTIAFSKSKFIDIVCNKIEVAHNYTGVNWMRERIGKSGNEFQVKMTRKYPNLILFIAQFKNKILYKFNEQGELIK